MPSAATRTAAAGKGDDTRLEAKVAALRGPSAYPAATRAVATIETHFAWVFLTDDLAYKLKKPFRNQYVDLTTAAARRWNCEEEVRLNRRLAADTYLCVSSLNRAPDGSLRIGGSGPAVDWLVTMRRLPAEMMLDRLILRHAIATPALQELGRKLADFYQRQQPIVFEPHVYVERVAEQIREDRRALYAPELDLDGCIVQSTTAEVWRAFSHVEAELAQRARDKRIVEAHGDLRPEHICMTSPPRVIDGLEFSLDLRTLDWAEELAFLRMECGRLGDAGAAERILGACLQEMADPLSTQLLQFYCSRRAMVRAKIVAWHLCDPLYRSLSSWREQAHSYLQDATQFAQAACGAQSMQSLSPVIYVSDRDLSRL